MGPAGIGLSLVTVNTATVRMLASPESHRTRIFGTVAFISGLVMPIGALGSGFFAEHLSPSSTLLVLGCVVCVCGLAANAVRILVEFPQMSDEELDNAYERRFPEAFAPRPVPART